MTKTAFAAASNCARRADLLSRGVTLVASVIAVRILLTGPRSPYADGPRTEAAGRVPDQDRPWTGRGPAVDRPWTGRGPAAARRMAGQGVAVRPTSSRNRARDTHP